MESHLPEGKIAQTVQDQLAAIGKVVVKWSMFELMLDMAIQDLAGLPSNTGSCLTSQISGHGRKLDAVLALIGLRKIPDEKRAMSQMRKVADRARGLAEQRNRIVHDPWFGNMAGGIGRYQITARKALVFEMKTGTQEELETIAANIQTLTSDFARALHNLTPDVDLSTFT